MNTWAIDMPLDWAFVEIALKGPLVFFAFCLFTRYRWIALGGASLLGIAFLGYLWHRDLAFNEHLGMVDPVWNEPSTKGFDSLGIESGEGGLEFMRFQFRTILSPTALKSFQPDTRVTRFIWIRLVKGSIPSSGLYPGRYSERSFDQWGFRFTRVDRPATPAKFGRQLFSVTVPIWCPMSLLALVSLLAWRRQFKLMGLRRRVRQGRCVCGYDLQGHRAALLEGLAVGQACPECGRGIGLVPDPKLVAAIRSHKRSSSVLVQIESEVDRRTYVELDMHQG